MALSTLIFSVLFAAAVKIISPLHYLNDNRTYLDLKAEVIGSDNRLQEEISGTTATSGWHDILPIKMPRLSLVVLTSGSMNLSSQIKCGHDGCSQIHMFLDSFDSNTPSIPIIIWCEYYEHSNQIIIRLSPLFALLSPWRCSLASWVNRGGILTTCCYSIRHDKLNQPLFPVPSIWWWAQYAVPICCCLKGYWLQYAVPIRWCFKGYWR